MTTMGSYEKVPFALSPVRLAHRRLRLAVRSEPVEDRTACSGQDTRMVNTDVIPADAPYVGGNIKTPLALKPRDAAGTSL